MYTEQNNEIMDAGTVQIKRNVTWAKGVSDE